MYRNLLFVKMVAAGVLLGCAACGSDDDDAPVAPSAPVTPTQNGVEFIATLSEPARNTDTSFESGDAISVWAVESTNGTPGTLKTSGNYANNVRYNYNGSRFVAASTPIDKTSAEKLNYYAVYPYSSSNSASFTFQALANQSTRANYIASDLCVARTSVMTSMTVDLSFSHAMSQVIINVASSFGTVTGVELTNVYTRASVNLNGYTCTATGSRGTVTMASNGTRSYRAIIAPQSVSSDTQLAVIHTSARDYVWAIETSCSFTSGRSITFELSPIDEEEAVTIGGTITPWITD